MAVSAQKSSVTLITLFKREYGLKPRITLLGEPIPVLPTTTLLGVTLDRGCTFRQHFPDVNARARLNVKESQTTLYKQFVRPVLTYASPTWAPDLALSHMEVIQRNTERCIVHRHRMRTVDSRAPPSRRD